jgi:hypothetical protein
MGVASPVSRWCSSFRGDAHRVEYSPAGETVVDVPRRRNVPCATPCGGNTSKARGYMAFLEAFARSP